MSDCMFCASFVGEENGDGGCKGRSIGNKDICEQCLAELKYWLNGTLAKSPSMRETPLPKEESENEENEEVIVDEEGEEERETEDDPFSSAPKE